MTGQQATELSGTGNTIASRN